MTLKDVFGSGPVAWTDGRFHFADPIVCVVVKTRRVVHKEA